MDREYGVPELLYFGGICRYGLCGGVFSYDQVWQGVPYSQSGEVLGDCAGELGEGNGSLGRHVFYSGGNFVSELLHIELERFRDCASVISYLDRGSLNRLMEIQSSGAGITLLAG